MTVDTRETIAVVGASARAAVFSLLRAGYKVAAADLFADADLAEHCPTTRVTPYPEGFSDWLSQTPCDRWLYTGALENYPELVDQLATLRPLQGHHGETLRRVRDPLELQSVLNREGFRFPETQLTNGRQPKDESWIGKTYRGSCGSGVGGGDATYMQQRITGLSFAAIFNGERLLGTTRQLVGETWTGASEYKYCGSIGPWALPEKQEQQLLQLGIVLCENFGLTDLYGVDFIFDGEEIWMIEVNPRYTASVEIVERASGISVFDISQPAVQSSLHHGKAILYAEQPLSITQVISDQLLGQAGEYTMPQLADIPATGTQIPAEQPILTLFAEGDSCEAVESTLRERALQIQHDLYGATIICG